MSAPQQYDITRIGIVSIDTSLGPTTYVLPNAPGSEQGLIVKDWNGHASVNPITIVGIVDGSSSFTFDQDFQSALLVFNGGDWSLVDTANGPAGGDLGGQFPNPIVKKINGNPLGSTTPTSANLLIANGTLWQTEPMTGDTTITLSGGVTVGRINGNPLGSTTPTSANILLANGTQWGSTAVSGDVTINSSGAVNVGKINGNLLGTTTPSSGNLLIGDGTDWDSVAVSGDATITSSGAVNVAKINGAGLGATTATAAHILVADGANWQSVGMSGGATINSSGVVTLAGSLPPSGGASGDLSGSFPSPTVAKINGATLGTTTATAAHILVGDGSAWHSVAVSGNLSITSAGVATVTRGANATASNTTGLGSASGTGTMLGLAGSITPATSGTVLFLFNAAAHHSNAGGSMNFSIRFGTGAAPTNGDALTGTGVGILMVCQFDTANSKEDIADQGIVTGLSPGTTYWFDMTLDNGGAGTATIDKSIMLAVEL